MEIAAALAWDDKRRKAKTDPYKAKGRAPAKAMANDKGNDNCNGDGYPAKLSRAYPRNGGYGYGKCNGDLAVGGGRVRIRRLGKQRGWQGSEEQ
jgi:hypothetical protein